MTAQHNPAPNWFNAVLAALPHILWTSLIAWGKLSGNEVFGPAHGVLFLCIYTGVNIFTLIYASQGGWPLWSAAWYGYAAWSVMLLYGLAQSSFEWETNWQLNNFIVIASLASLWLGYLWLYRHDRRKGILASLFLMPVFASSMMEFVPNHIEAYMGLGVGIATGLVSGLIQYLPSWQADLRLAMVLNILAGISLAYTGVYLTEPPDNFISQPKFIDLFTSLGSYIIVAMIYFFAPIILWAVLDSLRHRPVVT